MKIKKDISYGIIPTRKNSSGECEFLVIYQYSPVKNHFYWIFPKGHGEPGERPQESALRELQEETGLEASIPDQTVFSIFYDFEHEGVLIKKEVQFFIGVVAGGEMNLQPEEVGEARWCNAPTARNLLSNENAKQLLDEVTQHLKQKAV